MSGEISGARLRAALEQLPVHWVSGYEWECEVAPHGQPDYNGEFCRYYDDGSHMDGLLSVRDVLALVGRLGASE